MWLITYRGNSCAEYGLKKRVCVCVYGARLYIRANLLLHTELAGVDHSARINHLLHVLCNGVAKLLIFL